jgi:hypothetical protein
MSYRMSMVFRVPDATKWQAVLARNIGVEHAGMLSRRVFHSIDDPNELMVQLEFESAESARSYLPSLPGRELRDEIGLEIYPAVFIGALADELSIDLDRRETPTS